MLNELIDVIHNMTENIGKSSEEIKEYIVKIYGEMISADEFKGDFVDILDGVGIKFVCLLYSEFDNITMYYDASMKFVCDMNYYSGWKKLASGFGWNIDNINQVAFLILYDYFYNGDGFDRIVSEVYKNLR